MHDLAHNPQIYTHGLYYFWAERYIYLSMIGIDSLFRVYSLPRMRNTGGDDSCQWRKLGLHPSFLLKAGQPLVDETLRHLTISG